MSHSNLMKSFLAILYNNTDGLYYILLNYRNTLTIVSEASESLSQKETGNFIGKI